MSQRGHYIVGLDIGSASIKTVITQEVPEESLLRVIGVGVSPAVGIRRGAVVDVEEAMQSIGASINQAEKMAGVPVEQVTVNVSGTEIFSQNAKGVVAVGKADGEVLEDDITRVLHAAQSVAIPLNKEILHVLPRSYRLDDQKDIKDPLGMHGVRLEVDTLIIGGSSSHLKNIARCVEQMGIALDGFTIEPIAAATAVLSRKQRELGVVVVNIGSATTSIAVFEEGDILHAAILPIGASHITNDIAIGLRTSVEVAEQVKLLFGTAIVRDVDKEEDIDLSQIDSQEEGLVSRHHVAEIIEARTEEILHFVNNELKTIGRAGLLPAGVVLTGGGSKLVGIVELAKDIFRLPAQIGYPQPLGGILDRVDDPEFSTVVGLVVWARENTVNVPNGLQWGGALSGGFLGGMQGISKKAKALFDKFLP
ncbi:MAG: cell division protein FtsA [Candidatus Moranbacteria bacterium]|nr:cell division protein FtsA [Candidatus Moranbacteria bacterium]